MTHSYYRLSFSNYIRTLFYKSKAYKTGESSFSFFKIIGYVLVVVLLNLTALLISVVYNILPQADLIIKSHETLISLTFDSVLIITSFTVVFSLFFEPDTGEMDYLKFIPVNKRHIFLSKFFISMLDLSLVMLISFTPLILFFSNYHEVSLRQIVLSIFVPLLGVTFYSLLLCLIINLMLELFRKIKKNVIETIYFSPFIATFILITVILFNSEGNTLNQIIGNLESHLEIFGSYSLFGNIMFAGKSTLAVCETISLIIVVIFLLLYFNSARFVHNYDKIVYYESASFIRASGKLLTNLSIRQNLFFIFIRKEILQIIREPKEIIVNIFMLLFFTYMIDRVFKGSDFSLIFIIYNIPFSFGSFLIHTMGREGSNIYILKMITTGRLLFLSKSITFIIIFYPLSALLYFLIDILFFSSGFSFVFMFFRMLMLLVVSILVSVYALFIATVFADYNPKRLMPNRGISILGEILYWFTGVIVGFIFIFLDKGLLQHSYNYIFVGLLFLACAIILLYYFYLKSIKLINEYNY